MQNPIAYFLSARLKCTTSDIKYCYIAQKRSVEVDYDTDESGFYRAKSSRPETDGARQILDSSSTRVNFPVELLPAEEVKDEAKWATANVLNLGPIL